MIEQFLPALHLFCLIFGAIIGLIFYFFVVRPFIYKTLLRDEIPTHFSFIFIDEEYEEHQSKKIVASGGSTCYRKRRNKSWRNIIKMNSKNNRCRAKHYKCNKHGGKNEQSA